MNPDELSGERLGSMLQDLYNEHVLCQLKFFGCKQQEATGVDLKKRGQGVYYKNTEVSQAIQGQCCSWALKQYENKD